MIVFFIDVEVLAQFQNFVGEESYLDLGAAGVALSLGEFFDDFIFIVWQFYHAEDYNKR